MGWHALLAPLPADAVPIERPLASSDVLASAEGAAIADRGSSSSTSLPAATACASCWCCSTPTGR